MDAVLSEITIYPVKSMAGVPLDSAQVERRGLRHDRRFMLVDREGRFVNGRENPQLLRIHCRLEDQSLRIEGPACEPVTIDVDPDPAVVQATVGRSTISALEVSPVVDKWFSDHLGMRCRLVFMGDASRRTVDPDYGKPDDEVSFADGYPIMIVSRAALDTFNGRADDAISMRRFRPNLVIADCPAHAEDDWRRVRIGGVELELVKRCDRCSLTTFDPDTAERHARGEPLRTLATYRRGDDGKVYFGVNAIPRSTGPIRAGDPVTVLD